MMKKFLLSMMALVCMMAAQGQNDVVTATLQHGNELTVFKMANALNEAINAAVDGDVITLSEGMFNAFTIDGKSLTIYGAGFEDDDVTGTRATGTNGQSYIRGTISNLHIEGCSFGASVSDCSIESLRIQNCQIGGITWSGSGSVLDMVLYSNVITGNVWGNSNFQFNSVLISNCYVGGRIAYFPTLSSVLIDHCVLNNNGYGIYYYSNSIFAKNDIYILSAETVVKNCIFYANRNFDPIDQENCYFGIGSNIFTDADGGAYSADRTFEIQQPDVWIGTDGTQIGLHGGQGWSKVPRIPVIKSLGLNVEGPTLKINYEAEVRE